MHLTKRGDKQPKTWNFRAPAKNLRALDEGGFNILNLANKLDFLSRVKQRNY